MRSSHNTALITTRSITLTLQLQKGGIEPSLLVNYLRRSIGQDRKPHNTREAIQFKLEEIQVERLVYLLSA